MKNTLRKEKIQAREALTIEERTEFSKKIVEKILASDAYRQADTIMLYKGIRGEVRLDALEEVALQEKKKLCYPLCISKTQMVALSPDPALGEAAWKAGAFGIKEPMPECSEQMEPESIDLIICPCTAFDEAGGRMGMGGGYYDRFLPKCERATVAAVAFECQKSEGLIMEAWDQAMELVFTEETVYRK